MHCLASCMQTRQALSTDAAPLHSPSLHLLVPKDLPLWLIRCHGGIIWGTRGDCPPSKPCMLIIMWLRRWQKQGKTTTQRSMVTIVWNTPLSLHRPKKSLPLSVRVNCMYYKDVDAVCVGILQASFVMYHLDTPCVQHLRMVSKKPVCTRHKGTIWQHKVIA